MTTIFERVQTALSGLGVPVKNGQIDGELPETYIVWQIISAPVEQEADNKLISKLHTVQVNIWSRKGATAYPDVESAMTAAGFAYESGRDLVYSEDSKHSGYGMDFNYLEER